MSLSRRRIDVDSEMPIREVLDLMPCAGDAIQIRVHGRLFLIQQQADEGANSDFAGKEPATDATERLLTAAGGWKGLVDGDALKRYIDEGRELEAEIERKRLPRTF